MQVAYLSTLLGVVELFGRSSRCRRPGRAAEPQIGEAGGVDRLQQLLKGFGLEGAVNVCF